MNILDAVVRYCGRTPSKKGKNLFINSPFNTNDFTASCQIIPETNSFRCFSTNTNGDIITFVAKIHSVKNIVAATLIANDFGININDNIKRNIKELKVIAKQRLDLELHANYLTDEINLFFQKIADEFKYYDRILNEISHNLNPDDELLITLLNSRNHYEILCSEFIKGNFQERYNLYTREALKI